MTEPTARADAAPANAGQLRLFVYALFFIFGGITSLNDVLIPKLKALFTLSYGEVMLVQSAFFFAYFTVSIPGAAIVKRIGYLRTAAVGLVTMTAGCLAFGPASASGAFPAFLAALFVLAAGITIVQVVANPLISLLGPPATAHSRLTFAQAFNSLGTTIFPYVGSILILGALSRVDASRLAGAALTAYRARETHTVVEAYLGLAAALAVVAGVVWLNRRRLVEAPPAATDLRQSFDLLRRPRFAYGAACIFLYVGAEVSIGSFIVNFLMQPQIAGMDPQTAGKHVPIYWGCALVGRFLGAFVLRWVSPGLALSAVAAGAIALLAAAGLNSGPLAGYALLAVGLCNAIMFPTIFSLACEGLGPRAADGSGIICVAIVGGAVVPLAAGHAADLAGIATALAVPAACYAAILGFGLFARRPAPELAAA